MGQSVRGGLASTYSKDGFKLHLDLANSIYASGQPLFGVVRISHETPVNIRSITVEMYGLEAPTNPSMTERMIVKPQPFFEREVLLSGKHSPTRFAEKTSLFWNEFLKRDHGHSLASGEHIYPFAIGLLASLPPSYNGKSGTIEYRVRATVTSMLGKRTVVETTVPIVAIPRHQTKTPVAINYSKAERKIEDVGMDLVVELPQQNVALGDNVHGKFRIHNPAGEHVDKVKVSLEKSEWVMQPVTKELVRDTMESVDISSSEPASTIIEGDFSLCVPRHSVPTVQGMAISVVWLLKITVDADPPMDFKAPITVYSPMDMEERITCDDIIEA